ncbi:MAG TPA: UbiH/UbiF/VisC/COQ6 family ubiquinone biosynthesis hydroxylase [Alphaproteobacteria bacterium]|nr:UbiH/UbiF/VisC/COQ6 family ubiquinone biosynthesis hydroxylase [Alphaproteobacteria bacterium]
MPHTNRKTQAASSAQARPETHAADVVVVGGGISGLSLSAILARGGLKVICVDRDDPATQAHASFDGRTMAISAGSRRVLEAAGLWESVEPGACPIREIAIYDGGGPRRLTFSSKEADGKTFGWIVDIRDLRAGLFALAAKTPGLRHIAPAHVERIDTDGGKEARISLGDDSSQNAQNPQQNIHASLVVGADGRGSWTRRTAGIGTRGWSYGQTAIVCTLAHEYPHDNRAVEDFRPEGPFAILPMTDAPDGTHRSSLVWTQHAGGPDPMTFDDHTFDVALAARCPPEYGAVRRIGKRFSYPLSLLHAKTYVAPRRVLVADAAHGIHPIAGQGLNIGLRDVAALADLLIRTHRESRDIGSPEVLRAYERARRADNMAMAGATDLLTYLFSNDLTILRLARRFGLGMVARLPVARRFFVRQAMGDAGRVPDFLEGKG